MDGWEVSCGRKQMHQIRGLGMSKRCQSRPRTLQRNKCFKFRLKITKEPQNQIPISQLVYALLDETRLVQGVSGSPAPASKSEWHGQVLARPAITFCLLHRPCGSWISFSAAEMRKEGRRVRVREVEAC